MLLFVPLFLLMGGELVIAFLLARIAIWIVRGRRRLRATLQGPPGPGGGGGGGGFRAPAPGRRPARRAPPPTPRILATRRRQRAA